MNPVDRRAGFKLLESGTLVKFKIVNTEVHESADPAEFSVDIKLEFPEDPEVEAHDLEWGGLGFLFVIATLSFADARPRGLSENEYSENDEFHIGDFLDGLRWEGATLRYSADYLRGRRVKTNAVVRHDGTGALSTSGRGMTAVRWLERLQGEKGLHLVAKQPTDH